MQLSDRKRLHARCNPREALPAEDHERYVDVDDLPRDADREDSMSRPRRYAWVDYIAMKFESSTTPRQVLLTGLPGSGKTTELRRVAARLAQADGARLLPVHIDAEQILDLDQPIDVPEIVLAVLAETERAVFELEGMRTESKELGYESPFRRVWNYVRNTSIEPQTVEPVKIVLALKTDPSLRERVRQSVAARTSEFLERARGAMAEYESRVRQYEVHGQLEHKYTGVFVVFDSLEKLRGLSTNFREVLGSAEQVMRHDAELLNLGIHALYTVPIAIFRRVQGVSLMPLVKIRERDGNPFPQGLTPMRAIVEKRLSADDLVAIFGPQYQDRVHRIIERSGGYPHELIEMLRGALEVSQLPLGEAAFKHLLATRVDEYARKVTTEALPLLAKVARTRDRFIVPDEQAELAETLLTYSLVFVYQNDIEWADINPALASLLPA